MGCAYFWDYQRREAFVITIESLQPIGIVITPKYWVPLCIEGCTTVTLRFIFLKAVHYNFIEIGGKPKEFILKRVQTAANMSNPNYLAKPSTKPQPAKVAEPTRLEILKTKKGRAYAGENTDLDSDFKLTTGVIHYTGHLPGLNSSIGTSYPNLAKKSAMFLEEKGQPGWGGSRAPTNDLLHDKHGNIKPLPDQLKKDVANLYLQTSHPSMEIDTSIGVGYPAGRSSPGAGPSPITTKYFSHTINQSHSPTRHELTPSRFGRGSPFRDEPNTHHVTGFGITGAAIVPSERVPMEQPSHVAGYRGFIPGTRHMYGENFNRVDCRAREAAATFGAGGKGVTASVTAASPPRHLGTYESHNLMVANKNAVAH